MGGPGGGLTHGLAVEGQKGPPPLSRYENERMVLDDMIYSAMNNEPDKLIKSLNEGAKPNSAKDMLGDPVLSAKR